MLIHRRGWSWVLLSRASSRPVERMRGLLKGWGSGWGQVGARGDAGLPDVCYRMGEWAFSWFRETVLTAARATHLKEGIRAPC